MRRSVWGRRQRFPRHLLLLAGLVVLAVAAVALLRNEPAATPLTGRAEAVDGDTLRLGATRIRLLGLDAPELAQDCSGAGGDWPCGAEARAFTRQVLAGHAVTCARFGRDVYGRTLARCDVDGSDLGRQIVAAGWAVSNDAYLAEQADARSAARGIWSGTFEPPAAWRRDHGAAEPGLWDWIRSWFQ